MRFRRILVRNADAPELVELFLIASVFAVLAIRAFLTAVDFPQVGVKGLHIAHVLWGGLFMMLALLMLFNFLGRAVQRLAAILAGVGFGTFVDELGKFVTSDNNYFFRPTIGIIYIIFIAVFLLVRTLRQDRLLRQEESLANVFHILGGVADGTLDSRSKREATALLLNMETPSPLVHTLGAYVNGLGTMEPTGIRSYKELRDSLIRGYSRLVLSRLFTFGLTGFFVLLAAGQLFTAVVTLGIALATEAPEEAITFARGTQITSVLVAGAMILFGAWRLRRSRFETYRWFTRAILVYIFVTQVFSFFDSELGALGGLLVNVLVYIALRLLIEREESLLGMPEGPESLLDDNPARTQPAGR